MDKIIDLSKTCKEFFIKKANELSITTGFIKRRRKITGSAFVRTLILGNMADGNCSIEGMCQLLWEDAVDITKQGLDFRFTESAVEFMQAMYKECMNLFQKSLHLDCEILKQFRSVKLLDSSQVNLPNNMEHIYRGCGSSYKGRSNKSKAAIKLQVVFDYLHQVLDRMDLTEGIRSDQGYRNYLEDIKTNDLLIADLGYFVPGSFRRISESGAYFISRYKADTNLYEKGSDLKLDLPRLLENKTFITMDVLLGKEAKLPVRIICYKLTDEQSIVRRRKANLLAKGHKYKSSQRNQQLLQWSLFITNIPESKISAEHIWTIYRARWQIELLFKLYKSHIKIETIKGKSNSYRVLCELYAKLCGALIFHGILGCAELRSDNEISMTKAVLELKKRSREMFLILNQNLKNLQNFLEKLVLDWSKFCLKDRYRKTRLSSLNMLRSIDIKP